MFLLSRFPLDINSKIKCNEIKSNHACLTNNLTYKSFFIQSLVESNLYYDIEPIDNMYIIAYKVSYISQDSLKIIEKVDLSKYIEDILSDLNCKKFDFYNYTPEYLYNFVKNNKELKFILRDHFNIIKDILKKSLNESIYSISSIRNFVEVSDDVEFLYKESFLSDYIDSCSPNSFYSTKILDDLIFFAENTNSKNLTIFKYIKNIKWKDDMKINPF